MSTQNITIHLNGTSNREGKNLGIGLSFFNTVLLTLFIVISVISLSLAYYMVRKRALNKMKHQLVPLYHFDPGEFDNWEDELLGNSVQEKARFGHQFYRSLSSPAVTTFSQINFVNGTVSLF